MSKEKRRIVYHFLELKMSRWYRRRLRDACLKIMLTISHELFIFSLWDTTYPRSWWPCSTWPASWIQVHSSCWGSQDWSTSTSGSGFPSLSFTLWLSQAIVSFSILFPWSTAFMSPCSFSSPCWWLQISSCLTHVYPKHSACSGWVLRKSPFLDVLLRCFFSTIALPWILPPCWPWHW